MTKSQSCFKTYFKAYWLFKEYEFSKSATPVWTLWKIFFRCPRTMTCSIFSQLTSNIFHAMVCMGRPPSHSLMEGIIFLTKDTRIALKSESCWKKINNNRAISGAGISVWGLSEGFLVRGKVWFFKIPAFITDIFFTGCSPLHHLYITEPAVLN